MVKKNKTPNNKVYNKNVFINAYLRQQHLQEARAEEVLRRA